MPANTRDNQITAACLTPPGVGGIAVVEVMGHGAAAVVNPLLAARRPVDVGTMDPGELRLCRIVDRGEVLDDAVVAGRRLPNGTDLIDISVHGGLRIVQRLLLALRAAGVSIIEADTHAWLSESSANVLEAEAFGLLGKAKTQAVATWLARAPAALATEAERIDRLIAAGQLGAGRTALEALTGRFIEARYLLDGIRLVLSGEPNSGKSTLANALAGAEHSIVSEAAGTTRDWVEVPATMDGIPVTLVDTAGVRATGDDVERESIRRALDQIATADIVLRVIDRSAGRELSGGGSKESGGGLPDHPACGLQRRAGCPPPREVRVWNKRDLAPDPNCHSVDDGNGVQISARTGEGLVELRRYLVWVAGMTDWSHRPARLYSERQHQLCLAAIGAIQAGVFRTGLAEDLLHQEANS